MMDPDACQPTWLTIVPNLLTGRSTSIFPASIVRSISDQADLLNRKACPPSLFVVFEYAIPSPHLPLKAPAAISLCRTLQLTS